MQRLPKQLVPTAQLTNVVATYYPVPSLTSADIASATATNVSALAQTVTVYLVPNAGTAGATNIVVQTRNVPANTSVQLWEIIGQKMSAGGTIQAISSAAGAINLSIGGYEIVA